MSIFTRILGSLEARLSQPKLNIWRTIYINFRTLPTKQAIKLPIFIYGRVRLFMLNGQIILATENIKRGMIKIGRNADSFSLFDHSGFISLGSKNSRIIFDGPASISLNSKIRVPAGTLHFGEYVYIGASNRIICNGEYIKIGRYTRVAFESVIMNSGFHHVYNENKQSIVKTTRPIIIGEFCWIGNRSSITAGAKLKDYSIVCSNSLINKDFSSTDGENQMLGGAPAKLIGTGFHRVFSPELESKIEIWFKEHPRESIYHLENFKDNLKDLHAEF